MANIDTTVMMAAPGSEAGKAQSAASRSRFRPMLLLPGVTLCAAVTALAAALQAAQSGPAPTLIRIETRAGHGAGKPTAKVIEEAADRWAFLVEVLGMEFPKVQLSQE